MGRGRGGRSSGSRGDNFSIEYEFELFTRDDNDQLRTPVDGPLEDSFTFKEVVENFEGEFIDNSSTEDGFDSTRISIPQDIPEAEEPVTFDLTTRFLEAGTILTVPALNGNEIPVEFVDDRVPDVIEEDRIEYIITGPELRDLGISEFTLIIKDADEDETNGFQIGDFVEEEEGFRVGGVGGEIVEINDATIDMNAALSDIEYIIDNGLLGEIDDLRVSGAQEGNPNNTVSTEDFVLLPTRSFEPIPDPGDGDVSFEPGFGMLDGDVIEVEGSNQLIFTGDSNDLIDASIGSEGGNRIYAGSGDDTLILGTGDRLVGGEGDDRFFVTSEGDNVITGGEGADQFWIASAEFPDAINLITDFTLDEDVIGIGGLGIDFDDVSLTQQGDDALIGTDGKDLALLQDINTSDLSADDFVFS